MRKMFILSILISLLITGCASRESVMKSWMGNHIDDLTASWGSPSSIVDRSDGGKTYTWSEIVGNAYGVHQCRQTFVTNSRGTIISWSYSNCSEHVRTN